jgi:hypothetical protein
MTKRCHNFAVLILLALIAEVSAIRLPNCEHECVVRRNFNPAQSIQIQASKIADCPYSLAHMLKFNRVHAGTQRLRGGSPDRFFSAFDNLADAKHSGINPLDMLYDGLSTAVMLLVSVMAHAPFNRIGVRNNCDLIADISWNSLFARIPPSAPRNCMVSF